ncbi:hypothetical protein BT69DRAFT_1232257, partial [Atractiella rhizophila]
YDQRLHTSTTRLSHTLYTLIAIGDSSYGPLFCKQPLHLSSLMSEMGARQFLPASKCDVAVDPEETIRQFASTLSDRVNELASQYDSKNLESWTEFLELVPIQAPSVRARSSKAKQKLAAAKEKAALKARVNGAASLSSDDEGEGKAAEEDMDIEDLVAIGKAEEENVPKDNRREMITPLTRKALTKQGYELVGSHSGVKTCRWTKSAIRGRGFCYKHAFYGIQSHRCMETTPSLACANKCTFCWRSHTNPVGTTWRWKVDDAEEIVDGAIKGHLRLIGQLKGLPGLREERFEEAKTPRHAALSLVGEPIFYPQIREYIEHLHSKHISTFLVTNAQFPAPLRSLGKVTQLYLSIDAGTKESLKRVDQPLHKDFWERFLECIDIVRDYKMRTVFRLTLVKEYNTEELDAYAELVRRGNPDFVEVKGVTYCGYGGSGDLTIKNSPFHDEVCNFVQALVDRLDGLYGMAAEHRHSCCVLAARQEFYDVEKEEWRTWIDYDRFFELVEGGKDFTAIDYSITTPEWAVYGSPEAGFSPEDTRWFRKKKGEE